MKRLLTIILISLLLSACASPRPWTREEKVAVNYSDVICTYDSWWLSLSNENTHFYKEYMIGHVVFHLCGSRITLWQWFNKRHSIPLYLHDDWYMLTVSGDPIHVWLVVKIIDSKAVFHKHALGHEMLRVFNLMNMPVLEAHQY